MSANVRMLLNPFQGRSSEGGDQASSHGPVSSNSKEAAKPKDEKSVQPSNAPQEKAGETETSVSNDARIRELEKELSDAKEQVESLRKEKEKKEEEDTSIMMLLQEKLQNEMALKAEAENKMRLAQKQVTDLKSHGKSQDEKLEDRKGLEQNFQHALDSKEEAENDLRTALERITSLEDERAHQESVIEKLRQDVSACTETIDVQVQELEKLRAQSEDHERKEMSLTSRLNAAKKKEAEKVNAASKLEEELSVVQEELKKLKTELEELKTAKNSLEKESEDSVVSSKQRLVELEAALADERKLNEDRKIKMKGFIEKKSEELQQAKADQEGLQQELNHTMRSLSDLNVRWKQLHAQWVQSQTRNRELQRDLLRIKKDSENLHKVGDSLEMKLSSSAKETEEHKNKRLAAKTELMTVLRTLEVEREVSARLRDSIKFTFTPKALSQQQLLNETLEDFEAQLLKLAIRMRKTLPPVTETEGSSGEKDNEDDDWVDTLETDSTQNADTYRLIEKLNRETQQVSKCIMALVAGIERLHLLLEIDADRDCYSVLNDILLAGGVGQSSSGPRRDDTTSPGGSVPRVRSGSSQDYRVV